MVLDSRGPCCLNRDGLRPYQLGLDDRYLAILAEMAGVYMEGRLWLLVLDGWRPFISAEIVGGHASFYLHGLKACYIRRNGMRPTSWNWITGGPAI